VEAFKLWGEEIRPEIPWLSQEKQYFQMWRNSEVLASMSFAVCTQCQKPFGIFSELCQKQLKCPYCGESAVLEKPAPLLTKILKEILKLKKCRKRLRP